MLTKRMLGALWMGGAVLSFTAMAIAVRELQPRMGSFEMRTVIHFVGQVLWVYSIGALALATVFAIELTMPVWTALLAWLFLNEKLSPPRLVMLALGIAGVLLILRPGGGSFHPAALAMILGSLAAPLDFVRLPLIAVVGAAFYNEALDPMVFVGAAIIFAGTYYSLSRERH